MERFTPRFQGKPWVDGMQVIHFAIAAETGG